MWMIADANFANTLLNLVLFVLASTRPMTRAPLVTPVAILILIVACHVAFAQQTNPVDRKVSNPMTDTPNVNPLNTDQPVQRRPPQGGAVEGVSTDRLDVTSSKQSASGPENARIFVYEGNVDARIGTYRLQADKVTV